VGSGVMTAIAFLLFVGATGKSAQIPLYVWLPDAMEGPTPVSALIHAATMVTAGVYMITRMNPVFQLAPAALAAIATIGAVTAIYAASMGLVQHDIKRVLAYSTVSQLGYMFLALGVGAFTAGIFHLMTHAFFKALLFLGSGSVIHAMGGEQDMRKMGALRSKIPTTFWTFFVATVAISGIPPLAGFVSKDAILAASFNARPLLWAIGFITAGMTAFYMFRLVFLTFFGESRVPPEVEHHIHESPRSMTVPLMILALLSVVGGWIGWPESLGGKDYFARFLDPVIAKQAEVVAAIPEAAVHTTEYELMAVSVLVALIGIGLAWYFYLRRPTIPGTLAAKTGGLYRLIYNKYYVDQIYDAMFVNRAKDLGVALGAFDVGVIDGLGVNGVGWATRLASSIEMVWDKWVIDGLVNLAARIVWIISYPVRMIQSGRVSSYALLIVLGVLVFLGYFLRVAGVTLHMLH
jgi:NADH-quinone oxidoreductase subunit L